MNAQTNEEFLPDTVEGCMAEIDDLDMEVDQITAQIGLYDEGLLEGKPDDWRRRAVGALIHKKRDISQLNREILHINGVDLASHESLKSEINRLKGCLEKANAKADRYFSAIERQREQLQNQRSGKTAKIRRIHHAQQRSNYALTKAKQYVSENCPHLIDGLHACLTMAQAEYDATYVEQPPATTHVE